MGKELYVRHVSDRATEEDIRRLFSVSGTVTSVHLVSNPEETGGRRCCFVRMAADSEARDAIETLDGALLIDRTIFVNEARPQKLPTRGRPPSGRKKPDNGFKKR